MVTFLMYDFEGTRYDYYNGVVYVWRTSRSNKDYYLFLVCIKRLNDEIKRYKDPASALYLKQKDLISNELFEVLHYQLVMGMEVQAYFKVKIDKKDYKYLYISDDFHYYRLSNSEEIEWPLLPYFDYKDKRTQIYKCFGDKEYRAAWLNKHKHNLTELDERYGF